MWDKTRILDDKTDQISGQVAGKLIFQISEHPQKISQALGGGHPVGPPGAAGKGEEKMEQD